MLQSLISKGFSIPAVLLVFLLATACQPEEIGPQTGDDSGEVVSDFTNGVFVINEGNFTWGNGSLSYYNPDDKKTYNHLFEGINEYPLGDVPQSIRKGEYDYCLTVNNSNSVIFCDFQMKVIKEFTGINSPRYSTEDDEGNVYTSSMYGGQVMKINKERTEVDTFALFDEWTENIIWHDDFLYLTQKRFGQSDSLSKNMVFKLDTAGRHVDSLVIGMDISVMRLISPEKIVVLSHTEEHSKLWFVNLTDFSVEEKEITGKASFLSFSASKQQLYYFKEGIYSWDLVSNEESLIKAIDEKNAYGFNIDALRSEFYLCDAKDFTSKGDLLRYDFEGNLIDSTQLSVIPGEIYFEHNL